MKISNIHFTVIFSVAITLGIGWILAKLVKRMLMRWKSSTQDKGIFTFLGSFCSICIQILAVVIALSQLGVNTNVIVGALSACTLGISMALKDSMANVAGGIQLLITKPFEIGHYIRAESYEGTVKLIEVMFTVFQTPDNQDVIVPNSYLVSHTIVNFSKASLRRIHVQLPIGVENDIEVCKQVLTDVVTSNPGIDQSRDIRIEIDEFHATTLILGIYCWCPMEQYWNVLCEVRKDLHKKRIEEHIQSPQKAVIVDSTV